MIGVLTQFMGMRKVYTKGINNANKQFILAAVGYNLKKYLMHETKVNQPQRGEGMIHGERAKQPFILLYTLKSALTFIFDETTTMLHFSRKIYLTHN